MNSSIFRNKLIVLFCCVLNEVALPSSSFAYDAPVSSVLVPITIPISALESSLNQAVPRNEVGRQSINVAREVPGGATLSWNFQREDTPCWKARTSAASIPLTASRPRPQPSMSSRRQASMSGRSAFTMRSAVAWLMKQPGDDPDARPHSRQPRRPADALRAGGA